MIEVFVISDNIITSLGFDTDENVSNIKRYKTGITKLKNLEFWTEPFFASLINSERLKDEFSKIGDIQKFTRFEQICIFSASNALNNCSVNTNSSDTIFIISTTKGNIDLLKHNCNFDYERVYIDKASSIISSFFNNPNTPIIVSNACISGVLAINTAKRLISSGIYKNAIIIGGDIISEFVVSGFQSFKSLSFGPCKPFDIARDGLSLGEGASTIILSSEIKSNIKVLEGASANDANHISGPSKTGEGLYISIEKALNFSGIKAIEIDYISAHGTATPYNDEMEAIAISRAGLLNSYVNSYKGYFGHTLGAAGIAESVLAIYSLKYNFLFASLGFENKGVSEDLKVIEKHKEVKLNKILKIASGFGGCNASIIFDKI
ncbi:MAG: hypothetical protein A2046_16150 [Bacteroidetes bacterium GWA2_30_7]|nr:MAG: hypothetical protein A2046_16150 [Bacteroidetes bacterium GWA2_30_7]